MFFVELFVGRSFQRPAAAAPERELKEVGAAAGAKDAAATKIQNFYRRRCIERKKTTEINRAFADQMKIEEGREYFSYKEEQVINEEGQVTNKRSVTRNDAVLKGKIQEAFRKAYIKTKDYENTKERFSDDFGSFKLKMFQLCSVVGPSLKIDDLLPDEESLEQAAAKKQDRIAKAPAAAAAAAPAAAGEPAAVAAQAAVAAAAAEEEEEEEDYVRVRLEDDDDADVQSLPDDWFEKEETSENLRKRLEALVLIEPNRLKALRELLEQGLLEDNMIKELEEEEIFLGNARII